jgi:hypothetical protein
MGVNIKFPKFTLDCGYFGFMRLRGEILKNVPHQKLKDLYDDRLHHMIFIDKEREKKYFAEFDKKINDINYIATEGSTEEEKKMLSLFSDFFWAPDCGSKMKLKHVKAIWHYIKDCNDDFPFGYSGRKDCAHFQQFKQGIKDCLDNKKGFSWV